MIVSGLIGVAWMVSLAFHQPRWLIGALQRTAPSVLWRLSAASGGIALTFDDGPDPLYTVQVLEILRRYNAKATFFVTGENAKRYPQLIARIRNEGHGLANHLYDDRYIVFASEKEIDRWLTDTEAQIGPREGRKFVRPPRLLFNKNFRRVASRSGYTIVLGSGYVSDPYRPPAALIAWSMKRMLYPGAILVLHDAGGNRANTITALPSILEAGAARGLQFVTLQALVDRENTKN